MRRLTQSLVALVVYMMLAVPVHAFELPKPKLIAVYFWSSYCPNCKILTPQLIEARKVLDTKDVLFVTLDLSDSATIHQSTMLASTLGIAPFVQAQGSATGYVAVLKADKKTELARFDRSHKTAHIVAVIEKLLGEPPAK
ncbi:MAG: thioredoxin-like domain-containing protein [Rickettsiales bacterium]